MEGWALPIRPVSLPLTRYSWPRLASQERVDSKRGTSTRQPSQRTASPFSSARTHAAIQHSELVVVEIEAVEEWPVGPVVARIKLGPQGVGRAEFDVTVGAGSDRREVVRRFAGARADADAVVDGCDSFATRLLVAAGAVAAGIALVNQVSPRRQG